MIDLETLEMMSKVDIRTVNAKDLVDIKNIKINHNLSYEEKMLEYIDKMGNPYIHGDDGSAVKVSYAKDTDLTIDDCISHYLKGL